MTQVVNRSQKNTLPVSPPSIKSYNLYELISVDPILTDYFKRQTNFDYYWKLAHDLMLDGIRYRSSFQVNNRNCCCQEQKKGVQFVNRQKQMVRGSNNQQFKQQIKNIRNVSNQRGMGKSPSNQKNKHYNISYIKHNRFLSPSQRKQLVTPKVTEVVPVKSTPLVIYGKPRVKIDDQYGCPYHQNEEQCWQSIPYGQPCREKTSRVKPIHEVHVKELNQSKLQNKQRYNYQQTEGLSKYKSTPNLNKGQIQLNDFKKTTKNQQKSQKRNKKVTARNQDLEGQTVYVNKILEVQTRAPGKMRIIQSPNSRLALDDQSCSESYDSYLQSKYPNNKNTKKPSSNNQDKKQIQSKIKFLIQQDKKTKAMQRNMRKQDQRIKYLQGFITKQKKLQKPQKKAIKIIADDILSLSDSESSGMSLMNSQIVNKYKNKQVDGQKITQQRRKSNAAYFGIKNQERQQQQLQEDCSCSKTLNEDESYINEQNNQNQGSFSDFNM